MFRDDIRPEWEHDENTNGGKWVIFPPLRQTNEMWEVLLLACIGELLTESECEICGVVVSVRSKQSKIAVWTKNSSREVSEQLG